MHHQNIDLLYIHLTSFKNVSSSKILAETFNVQLRCTFKAYQNQESILLIWKDISLIMAGGKQKKKTGKKQVGFLSFNDTNKL